VTAGGDEVAGCQRTAQPIKLPALPVELVSTRGAGDMFVGTLASVLAAGKPLENSLSAANHAAVAEAMSANTGRSFEYTCFAQIDITEHCEV
jgi:sugar/nucleoside kinase (ribokinase family)